MNNLRKSIRKLKDKSYVHIIVSDFPKFGPVDEIQIQGFLKSQEMAVVTGMGTMLLKQLEHVTTQMSSKTASSDEEAKNHFSSCFHVIQIIHRLVQESPKYVHHFLNERGPLDGSHVRILKLKQNNAILQFFEKYLLYLQRLLKVYEAYKINFHDFNVREISDNINLIKKDQVIGDILETMVVLYTLIATIDNSIVKNVEHVCGYLLMDFNAMKKSYDGVSGIKSECDKYFLNDDFESEAKLQILELNIMKKLSNYQFNTETNQKLGLIHPNSVTNSQSEPLNTYIPNIQPRTSNLANKTTSKNVHNLHSGESPSSLNDINYEDEEIYFCTPSTNDQGLGVKSRQIKKENPFPNRYARLIVMMSNEIPVQSNELRENEIPMESGKCANLDLPQARVDQRTSFTRKTPNLNDSLNTKRDAVTCPFDSNLTYEQLAQRFPTSSSADDQREYNDYY